MSYMKCKKCGTMVSRDSTRCKVCRVGLDVDRIRAERIEQQLAGGKTTDPTRVTARAKRQGRLDGPYTCAVCGMRGPGPKCAEGDCEDGVKRFGVVLASLGIGPAEYFEDEELRDSVRPQIQKSLAEGSQS